MESARTHIKPRTTSPIPSKDSQLDFSGVSEQEIADKLATNPLYEIEDYCGKNPEKCRKIIDARRINDFGEDEVFGDAYKNPVHNYWAAEVRHNLFLSRQEKSVLQKVFGDFTRNYDLGDFKKYYKDLKHLARHESKLDFEFEREDRKELLKQISETRKRFSLTEDPYPDTKSTVNQLAYAIKRPEKYGEKARMSSYKLAKHLQAKVPRPTTTSVPVASLKLDWMPKSRAELKDFVISPDQDEELHERLRKKNIPLDSWVEFPELGNNVMYFFGDLETGNLLVKSKHDSYPPSFQYFLDKMGLTEETYKRWYEHTL